MIQFILNDEEITTDLHPATVLLDFIRYNRHLTGTKIGCREGDCGACTILTGELAAERLVYRSMTSCLTPLANIHGKHVVTIEGINFPDRLNLIQQSMADCGATQCGFCTPGFVMSLTGLCLSEATPTEEAAIAAIDGNICRCTGYKSIRKAATEVAQQAALRQEEHPVAFACRSQLLPGWFMSVEERLKKIPAAGITRGTTFIGGGTDLYVQKHDEIKSLSPQFVADVPGMRQITTTCSTCTLGGAVTVSDLREATELRRYFPNFERYVKLVSSTPIRNMATLAGNFVNASPIGDFTIFFLALNAQLTLATGTKERLLPLRQLYKGYKKLDKEPNEYIRDIQFELPVATDLFNFEKVSKRTHLDIASVNSAIHLKMDRDQIGEGSVSMGGVGPIPLFLEKSSALLAGRKPDVDLVRELLLAIQEEISPISDARGSEQYKRLLAGQLIKSHFRTLFPHLGAEILRLHQNIPA